jgi:hypothetical protein
LARLVDSCSSGHSMVVPPEFRETGPSSALETFVLLETLGAARGLDLTFFVFSAPGALVMDTSSVPVSRAKKRKL